MRVGIDGACWLNRRGFGRFARELVSHLAALDAGVEYTLLADFDPADAPPVPAGVRVVHVPTRRPGARAAASTGQRSLRDLWVASRAFSRERFDVVFFPSLYTYVPVFGAAAVVVVIHDLIPEQFSSQVFPTRRAAMQWWLKGFAARRRADLVMTVSESSRQAIAERFDIPAHRITVVSEASDPIFQPRHSQRSLAATLARWNLAERQFLLYVGGLNPHKNLSLLIEAFATLHRRAPASIGKLVLVGDYAGDVFHSAYPALQRQVAALELDDAVVFTGYIEDDALVDLYNGAAALVLPSQWEGFGLPAIEALACGTPVVASARGALPEVIGSSGLLFDPEQRGELEAVLQRLLNDAALQARLRQLGPQRAAEFSWERAARQTVSAFHAAQAARCGRAQPLPAAGLSQKERARCGR